MPTTLRGIRDKDIVTKRATVAVGKTMTTLAYAARTAELSRISKAGPGTG